METRDALNEIQNIRAESRIIALNQVETLLMSQWSDTMDDVGLENLHSDRAGNSINHLIHFALPDPEARKKWREEFSEYTKELRETRLQGAPIPEVPKFEQRKPIEVDEKDIFSKFKVLLHNVGKITRE